MKKVYISGRISGLPREQYMRLFFIAASMLKKKGYKPVNPTRFLMCRWPWLYRLLGYNLTLLIDLWMLMRCDLIYKIPGWQQSRGANIESCVAYHFKIWPVPKQGIAKLDKKLAKLQENGTIKSKRIRNYENIYCGSLLDSQRTRCNWKPNRLRDF